MHLTETETEASTFADAHSDIFNTFKRLLSDNSFELWSYFCSICIVKVTKIIDALYVCSKENKS